MDREEALKVLANGHTIISVEYAKEVCECVGVPFAKHLIKRWKSDKPATFKGLTMKSGEENSEGVYTLILSGYVAKVLGVEGKAGSFLGRGFQAQAYARVIKEELEKRKEV